jgi:hypothetical protein
LEVKSWNNKTSERCCMIAKVYMCPQSSPQYNSVERWDLGEVVMSWRPCSLLHALLPYYLLPLVNWARRITRCSADNHVMLFWLLSLQNCEPNWLILF